MRYEKPVSWVAVCLASFFLVVLLNRSVAAEMTGGANEPAIETGTDAKKCRLAPDAYGERSRMWHGGGAHSFFHGMRSHDHNPFERALTRKDQLNLTPQQIDEIAKQQLEYKKRQIRNSADLEIARLEMQSLTRGETIDESGLRDSAKAMGALVSKQIEARVEARIALLKILTPEQRKRIGEMRHDG